MRKGAGLFVDTGRIILCADILIYPPSPSFVGPSRTNYHFTLCIFLRPRSPKQQPFICACLPSSSCVSRGLPACQLACSLASFPHRQTSQTSKSPAMRNLLSYLLLALLNLQQQAAAQSTGQYCDSTSQVCYLQYSWGTTIPVFRLAVPDSASTGGNYDTLLQIVAPVSVKWAGFSWGGGMTSNPLTVVWPNGNSATVSSRWATYVVSPLLPALFLLVLFHPWHPVSYLTTRNTTEAGPYPRSTPPRPTKPSRPATTARTGRSKQFARGAAHGAADRSARPGPTLLPGLSAGMLSRSPLTPAAALACTIPLVRSLVRFRRVRCPRRRLMSMSRTRRK